MRPFVRSAAAALLFLAPPAVASVIGTAHETELAGVGGACAACHVPHQAGGEKFWAVNPVYEGKVGTVSALCGSCHHSGGAYGALMTRAHSDDLVYAPDSHGQRMWLANPPPGTEAIASGLPDVETAHGYFECSTCHSVHDDTYRPFLREKAEALCARCHKLRHYVGGLDRSGPVVEPGTWGVPSRLGTGNPGSHPVGEDVTGGRLGAPVVSIGALFKAPFSPEPGKWSLGGHLTKGTLGGVTCITCHAVHGTQPDLDDLVATGAERPPGPGFLTVPQRTAALPGQKRPLPNGNGGTSALCEGCHGVGNNPLLAPGGAPWSDPARNVSPGRKGSFSHPVDSYPSSLDARVSSFPAGWPAGDPAILAQNVGPVPICETCHAPHPAAALSVARTDVAPSAGPYLLRASVNATGATPPLCDLCHGQTVPGHHPVGKTFDGTGAAHLRNVKAGAGTVLTCGSCHGGAHNWRQPGWASLDPAWRPADNGRSTIQAQDMFHRDMSKTCMDCHYFMDGDGASVSPTLGSKQTVIATTDREYPHYQAVDRSMGTHYIGVIHEAAAWKFSPIVDMFDITRTWQAQNTDPRYAAGLAPGWARFGGEDRVGSRVLVCETCHELEPDRNRGFKHLLLAPYAEGENGYNEYPGDVDGHDILCEACHGIPEGTHPLTGGLVSRTGTLLNSNADWLRPVVLGYATLDRATNSLSCDSCHQPHDANSNSYTFMLDAPAATPIGAYVIPIESGIVDVAQPSALPTMGYGVAGSGQPGTYTTPTLMGMGGPHAGLCNQCHNQ